MKKITKRALCLLLCLVCLSYVFCGCADTTTSDTTLDTTDGVVDPADLIKVRNSTVSRANSYTNSLADDAADPMIIEHEGTYYLYATGNKILSVRTSKNLTTWSEKKQVFALADTTWGVSNCWAPEVHEYNGKFYLFFCGRGSDSIFRGSVAVCDTPDGTFVPVTENALLDFGFSVIDLSFFLDDDGKTYIFYSKDCSTNKVNGKKVSQSFGVEVSNDFTRLIGEPVLCTTPDVSWELKSGGTIWNEGPVVFKENGKYYMLYSANYYQSADYGVGYAVADSILGPYTKPKSNCIISGNGETITGPGHCNVLTVGGQRYVVYHAHTIPPNTDNGRSLYINEIIVREDGSLHVNGPTKNKLPLFEGINGVEKYKGTIEISASLSESRQNTEILTDGCVEKSVGKVVKFAEGDTVTFTFTGGEEIDAMWLYNSTMYSYNTKTVDVIINDKYIMEDVSFSSERGGVAIASFAKLEEGVKVEKITLSFDILEGSEGAAITEVTFVCFTKD